MKNRKGLLYLRTIRESSGLTTIELAARSGYAPDFIRRIETGVKDCSQEAQRAISNVLACTPADLLQEPTPARLAEIRAAYTQRVADAARQAVSEAS